MKSRGIRKGLFFLAALGLMGSRPAQATIRDTTCDKFTFVFEAINAEKAAYPEKNAEAEDKMETVLNKLDQAWGESKREQFELLKDLYYQRKTVESGKAQMALDKIKEQLGEDYWWRGQWCEIRFRDRLWSEGTLEDLLEAIDALKQKIIAEKARRVANRLCQLQKIQRADNLVKQNPEAEEEIRDGVADGQTCGENASGALIKVKTLVEKTAGLLADMEASAQAQ